MLGGKFRTSLTNAVLINGTSQHAQELESEGVYSGSLPMTNIPVALNAAEKFKLSGKAVIEGIIIGLEVETRLGMGGPGAFDKGFSSIPTFGTFGAAATAGKMMKLSVDQMQHAIGIGTAQSSGQQRQQGSMTHLLEAGIACRNGVTAALLAKEGVTSDPNLIEGERGFYDLFCSGGRGYDIEAVIRSLGNPFCITSPGVLIKKYANCFFNQRAMDALIELMKENDIHVSTRVIHANNDDEQKFKLPYEAPLLDVLQEGARLAQVTLLPNPEEPLDRLHVMLSHNEVGPPITDLQQQLGDFLKKEHEKNHFGIELVLAFRVNTRWVVAPQAELSPRQILELLDINYQDYTLYQEGSATPLPLDTVMAIKRGMVFEAQRDGKYGGFQYVS